MPDLSLLIPARNEMWLAKTVDDILTHIKGDTDVWIALDGPTDYAKPLPSDRVHIVPLEAPIGQRASANLLARQTSARYLMKVDAHCAFDDGFDVKLLAAMQPGVTMVPVMRNLHAFNWICANGHQRYQGPSGPCSHYFMCASGHQNKAAGPGKCETCGNPCTRHEGCGAPTEMLVTWSPKPNPSSKSFRFDTDPHFQYFGEWSKRPEGKGELTETMSLQGSCFLLEREKWLELNICDESWGSWGSQGIEVACKTWLSGGRVLCNQKTWYAHMFRTQGGDFSFPYSMSAEMQDYAKRRAREIFFNNAWPQQIHPLSWLLDKFKPVPGWHDDAGAIVLGQVEAAGKTFGTQASVPALEEVRAPNRVTRGMIYYTDGQLDPKLAGPVRERLADISLVRSLPIVTAALGPKLKLGVKNIVFPSLKRGHLTMFKQILAALVHSTSDVVFFCEHDVLYHPSHFDFVPPRADTFYYNTNVWQVKVPGGHAIYYRHRSLSQMCCYRTLAIAHYEEKLRRVEANGGVYDARMGFEPGTRGLRKGGIDDSPCGDWRSPVPNVDLRHPGTLSRSKWSQADFRHLPADLDWQEADVVPGWPTLAEIVRF